jgi:cytochrome c oxidase assembly protein subunit 11
LQATGFGGTVQKKETVEEKIARHSSEKKAAPARQITVQFNADVADGMPWKFTPCQREVGTLLFRTSVLLSASLLSLL